MNIQKEKIQDIGKGQLAAYAQVFFSDNRLLAALLMVVSFVDFYAGVAGFLAVFISNVVASLMGYYSLSIRQGMYSFNSLLVGLGTGLFFQPSWEMYIVTIMLAILTFFLSVTLQAWFGKYSLPFLSLPFLFSIWILILSASQFGEIGISERGIYTSNEIYALGGSTMLGFFKYVNEVPIPQSLRIYFLSLGAIFFQYNILAGWVISIGLLLTSRISFTLSLIGFYTAYFFYVIIGADITSLHYSYIGFNFILTSIAIGGFFLIPSKWSYFWVVILLPIVVLITIGTMEVLSKFSLSVYSLPFNLVVILFVYALKLRINPGNELIEPGLQLFSPEKNLYFYKNAKLRFKELEFFSIRLPFWGSWTVAQAHDGEYTHKENWRHAWDFVIEDENGEEFSGFGKKLTDYYTYNKNIVAPAEGTVVDIADSIEDNNIGDVNTLQNWGNSIVIKHTDTLFSQVSHLKAGSIKVRIGDFVRQGDVIGQVGNSGRSPIPHLHFQLQSSPFIGSPTLDYPISYYILKRNSKFFFNAFDKPVKGDVISNISTHPLLEKLLKYTPGQKLIFTYEEDGVAKETSWEIAVDPYNQAYFYDEATQSLAYFYNDGLMHYFKNYIGDKNAPLYQFYSGLYRIQSGYYKGMKIEDELPIHLTFSSWRKFLQDWIAPFYQFLKTKYFFEYDGADDELFPTEITFHSEVVRYCCKKKIDSTKYYFETDERGLKAFSYEKNEKIVVLKRK